MSSQRWAGPGYRVPLILLTATFSLAVNAYDQPDVKFHVELTKGGRIVECPVMSGSLGDALEVVLANGVKVAARAAPLDADGRSTIDLKLYSENGALMHEKRYPAKLSQQKPSFQLGGVTVLVESESVLKTTRNNPSWRDFDARTKPVNASEPHVAPQGCTPLLGTPERDR